MISNNISLILMVTGAVTMLPILQFLFTAQFLSALNKIVIRDEAGLFFARHWGMLAFVMGGLMFYAASHPEARTAIIGAALIEKAALVMMIALHWNRPFAKGFAVTALFDGVCCVIFALYLAGAA